jgi:diguanylate cyclase (GGDEF)-like protein
VPAQDSMSRPGFRKKRAGDKQGGSAEPGHGPFLGSALFSQAQILQLMRNEFARSRRHGYPLSCLLLQVDRMAQLVDLHGAAVRDAVRSNLALLVQGRTRGADLLGAWTEDRFLLLLPHTEVVKARVVADRVVRQFQELEVAVDGKVLALRLCGGLAASEDHQIMFFDSLVSQAEFALEHALGGGSPVVSFGEVRLLAPDGVREGPSPDAGRKQ